MTDSREKGITAVELLIAVAVLAILVGASMPLFLSAIQTSRFDGAVRRIVSDLRYTQSLAVTNGGCYGLHSGSDPLVGRPNEYRIERGGCNGVGWPAPTDTMATNANVITEWYNLGQEFDGVSITSLRDNANINVNGVIFNSRGASVNPFIAVAYPVRITVANAPGGTRTIEVRSTGSVKLP